MYFVKGIDFNGEVAVLGYKHWPPHSGTLVAHSSDLSSWPGRRCSGGSATGKLTEKALD